MARTPNRVIVAADLTFLTFVCRNRWYLLDVGSHIHAVSSLGLFNPLPTNDAYMQTFQPTKSFMRVMRVQCMSQQQPRALSNTLAQILNLPQSETVISYILLLHTKHTHT